MWGRSVLDFDAMAGVAPAFDPAHFTIDPHNLPASAHALAQGIAGGYSAAAALTLLSHDSAKAHVSFDRMLLLTEHDLGALKGADAVAGKHHFDVTIEKRLGSGNAEAAIAKAVQLHELSATVAASTVVGLARATTPGPHEIGHDLALLIHDLQADKVPAKAIGAAAAAQGPAILSGVAEQILLGGSHAPGVIEIAAAARVVEQHLPVFTAAAHAKFDTLIQHLDDTRAERAVLHTIETQALNDALADHLLNKAQERPWANAFRLPNEHLDAADKQLLAIATEFVSGQIGATQANDAVRALSFTPDNIVADTASRLTSDDPRDVAFAELAYILSTNASFAVPPVDPNASAAVAELFDRVSAPPQGEDVEADILTGVAHAGLETGHVTLDEVRAAFANGSNLTGARLDQWLMEAADAQAALNVGDGSNAAMTIDAEVYLAIAHPMADRVSSGALARDMLGAVRQDEMTVGEAVDFGINFAALAMDNSGSLDDDALALNSSHTQTDGITAEVRSGLFLAQFMHDVTGATKSAANSYIVDHHADLYLTGLGAYGMVYGGKALTEGLTTAAQVIHTLAMPAVQHAAENGSPQNILDVAENQLGANESLYIDGINAVGGAVAVALSHANGHTYGVGSIGAIATFADDRSLDNFDSLVYAVGQEAGVVPDNPIGDAGAIATFAQFILEDLGVGELLGPFVGKVLEGVADIVATTSKLIDDGLTAAIGAAVSSALNAGVTLVHTANNLGTMVKDLFTGDNTGAIEAANQLASQLGDDAKAFADALTQEAKAALKTIADDAVAIANDATSELVGPVGDAIDVLDGAIFSFL